MNDTTSTPQVNPAPDSAFSLPPDTVAYFNDYEQRRNRLTSFFRYFTALPHIIWVALYGIAAFFAVIGAWFALLFTAKYPAGLYKFVSDYQRYYTRVYGYAYLVTDKFPPFNGNPDETYAVHFLVGPPKESYSRLKVFFRWLLIIPFAIVAYVLMLVWELAAVVAWFVILFTGKQPAGLQDAMNFCFGFVARLGAYSLLLTEDWPKFSDEAVTLSLQERGYQGTIPPTASSPSAPETPDQPLPQ